RHSCRLPAEAPMPGGSRNSLQRAMRDPPPTARILALYRARLPGSGAYPRLEHSRFLRSVRRGMGVQVLFLIEWKRASRLTSALRPQRLAGKLHGPRERAAMVLRLGTRAPFCQDDR